MESINFHKKQSATRLRITPAGLAQIPHQNREQYIKSLTHPPSLPRMVARNRDRWSIEANLITLQPPTETAIVDNPHQWLIADNPRLAKLITDTIGDCWQTHLEDLAQLVPIADNARFQSCWQAVKQANKQALATALYRSQGVKIDPHSLFDLQLQPIEARQRQLLNIFYIINLIDRLKQNPGIEILPRTIFFSGSSKLPIAVDEYSYFPAEGLTAEDENRSMLVLIKSVAEIVAADPDLNGKLQVVYVPASAGLTSQLYAAADLVQEIATAAIGDIDLSKLRAAMNGVVSIGSLGKTNYWLQQLVGEQNCFRFGLAIPEIALFKEYGYDPYNYYKYYPQIRKAIDYLFSGYFTPNDLSLGRSIVDLLLGSDEHMVMADYIFYAACQARVVETYRQSSTWTQMSILNVAGVR